MAEPLGISFMPGGQDPNAPNGQRPTPVQQAIQTLALRIPRTVGAASGAPQALLMGAGGSGLGGNPSAALILEELRRKLFGGGANPGRDPLQLPTPQANDWRTMDGPMTLKLPTAHVVYDVPNSPNPSPAPPAQAPQAPTAAPSAPMGHTPLGSGGLFERGPRQKQV